MVVDTAGGLDDNGGAAVERGELARVRAEQLQKRRREPIWQAANPQPLQR